MDLNDKLKRWADDASETILFKPQREAVREEFLCHLQDSYDAKLGAGLSEKEAVAQVLADMGKPAPVAEQMAILYPPLWGDLWYFASFLKYIALVYLIFVLVSNVYSAVSARLSYDPDAYLDNLYAIDRKVADIRPENAIQFGDYTVSMHRMVLFDDVIYSDFIQDEDTRMAFLHSKYQTQIHGFKAHTLPTICMQQMI